MKTQDRKPYRLVPLSECVLFKLYIAHIQDDDNNSYSIEQIRSMFKEDVSRKLIGSALTLLMERPSQFVRRHGRGGAYTFSIADHGIIEVERLLRRGDTVAAYLFADPDASLDTIAGMGGIFRTEDEQAEEAVWAPLPIDRQSEEYKGAVEAIEEAYETIRADNGLAAQFPEQRAGILASIEAGIEVLKSKMPSAQQLRGMLIVPLQWVSATFAKTVIGEVAKKAAEKLIQFITSMLS
jgi:hypothetical protein